MNSSQSETLPFYQVRPLLPESGPLLWEIADDEQAQAPLRIYLAFNPRWFRARMGLDYRERWHRDPDYRRQSFVRMRQELNARFPRLKLGGEAPEQIPGSVSIIYGTTLVAGLFNGWPQYFEDCWPAHGPGHLSDTEADALEAPVLENCPVFQDLMAQMDRIEQEWGRADGALNFQGMLNNAFRLRGQNIFIDMCVAPERARHVLDVVTETMLRLITAVHERQVAKGLRRDYFVTSNCVVNMISGDSYEEFILPYDQKMAQSFNYYGVHNCGWNVNPYLNGYAKIGKPLSYLDFGMDSDLARIRAMFPETRRCVIYSPIALVDNSPEQIRRDLERLHEELSPCEIIIGDIESTTPDERVMEFYEIAARIWGVEVEALAPLRYTV